MRVADNAAKAWARLVFDVGGEVVSVERNLRDLSLRAYTVGDSIQSDEEESFQESIVKIANVSTFADWILLLRYLVFYFEDRRSLIWDPSAQRQLLRILFLDPDRSRYWMQQERAILEVDTRVRNLQAVTTREERSFAEDEALATSEPIARQELAQLAENQRQNNERLEEISSNLPEIEANFESARLRFLTLERDRESLYRERERINLLAVSTRMPKYSDTARYILAQLMTEADCLVCGNQVPSFRDTIEHRIRDRECIVCSSPIIELSDRGSADPVDGYDLQPRDSLEVIDAELEGAHSVLMEFEEQRRSTVTAVRELQTTIAHNTVRLESLLDQLPPEAEELHARRGDLASMRARTLVLRRELDEKRASFTQIITAANRTLERQAAAVQSSFVDYAHEFLLEDCRLLWSLSPPVSVRQG